MGQRGVNHLFFILGLLFHSVKLLFGLMGVLAVSLYFCTLTIYIFYVAFVLSWVIHFC